MPVDEEIVTHIYVASHVDITSSEDEAHVDGGCKTETAATGHDADQGCRIAVPTCDGQEDNREDGRGRPSVGSLPSIHRSKRKKRRWEWTIESLDKTEGETLVKAQKSTGLEQEESEDSLLAPPATAVNAEGLEHSSPQDPGCTLGLDETFQNESTASTATTSPKDDPPMSPWMVV